MADWTWMDELGIAKYDDMESRHPEDEGCPLCGDSKTCPMCDTDGGPATRDPQFQINPASETKLACPTCGIRVYVGVHAGLGYALWSHSTKVLHATTTGEHLPKEA